MNSTPIRTNFTLLLDMVKMLGGEPMKQAFLRDMGTFAKAQMVDKTLTEKEYQFWLQKIREEMPAFKQYLSQFRFELLPGGEVLCFPP